MWGGVKAATLGFSGGTTTVSSPAVFTPWVSETWPVGGARGPWFGLPGAAGRVGFGFCRADLRGTPVSWALAVSLISRLSLVGRGGMLSWPGIGFCFWFFFF